MAQDKPPVIEMARGELIIPRARRWKRNILIGVAIAVLVIVLVPTVMILRVGYLMRRHFHELDAAGQAMRQPENFKPAERYLARLMQSDPKLLKSDEFGRPPNWLPPELGKLGPSICDGDSTLFTVGGGGGFDDFFGYHLNKIAAESDTKMSTFELDYLGSGTTDIVLDKFTIAANDHIEEDEFVRSAIVELDRRKKAFADGSQPNTYGDDPVTDRWRLISQHVVMATKLGLLPTKTSVSAP